MKEDILANFRKLLIKFEFLKKYNKIHLTSKADIKKIPFTRREELQEWNPEFAPLKTFIFYEATGGKGGKNFFLGISKQSHEFMIERAIQAISLMCPRLGRNCLNLLFSDLVDNAILRSGLTLMSIGDVHNNRTLRLTYDAIEKLEIKYLFAAPNLLWTVFSALKKNHSIEKCMVSGELFLPWFRNSMQKATGISFYNWYGSSGGFIAAQDNPKDSFMRILDAGLYIELVDKNGYPLREGKGSLVYTDLFNYSTPIIRYLLEDEVEIIWRGRTRYVKVIARAGSRIKLDGELVHVGFLINEICSLLGHNKFLLVIGKSKNYIDIVNVFLLKKDLKRQKKILCFLKYFCICQKIRVLNSQKIDSIIDERGNLVDLRRNIGTFDKPAII